MQTSVFTRRITAVLLILVLCCMTAGCHAADKDGMIGTTAAQTEAMESETASAEDVPATESTPEESAAAEAAETTAAAETPAAETTAEAAIELPQLTLDTFPVIDGSLACVPMIDELIMRSTGCSEVPADDRLNEVFSNTNPCYLNLAAGERDICIAYEPAQDTVEQLKALPPLTMDAVGKDALVFIVNENNPVDELTREQLMDIFTGKIRNWSEVGGADVPIEVYTRPETSGSQTLLRKLLVGDADMTDETYYYMEPTMEGMVKSIKEDFDNTEMAIGYSVYYYVSEMMGTGGLKFLKVDGAEPSNDAIRTGAYPLVNDFYAVLREDSPEEAAAIRDWLLSEEGQKFVEECGYVPVR